MDIRRTLVCVVTLALVAGFAGNAGAAEEVAGEAAVNDETPYIDEDGNFDAAMAKDYAEQVDSYVDEFGIAWDVWLDEFGGQMWAETTNPKALEFGAVESVSLSEGTTSEQQATTLVLFWFYPNYVKVWRHDMSPSTVTYSRAGTVSGVIDYWGSCPGITRCSEWRAAATYQTGYVYDLPDNVYQIQGLANSNWDVCDGSYDGAYGTPPGGWYEADSQTCSYLLGQYVYYTNGWDAFDEDDDDYDVGDRMVRWDYVLGGLTYSVRVYWNGIIPG